MRTSLSTSSHCTALASMSDSSSRIDAATRIVLLIGDPIEHSLSPRIHNTAFALQDINAMYAATPVSHGALSDAVNGMRALQILGANVTIPHKEAIVPLLDSVSPRARAVGAVNTVIAQHDGEERTLHGDNTDVAGFLAPLSGRAGLHGADMTILGAGGAARAAAYALITTYAPSALTVAARRPAQAEALLDVMQAHADPATTLVAEPLDEADEAVRRSRLVVNATPVGMAPHADDTPWPRAECFSPDHLVYDLVYAPRPTRLLREAAREGADTQDGLEMLIGQAAASYALWTDRSMPTDQVRDELLSMLPTGPDV